MTSCVICLVQAKLKGYREQIAGLNRALAAARTRNANLAGMAKANEEKLDAAVAKAKTTEQKNARLQKDLRVANMSASDLGKRHANVQYKLQQEKADSAATKEQVVVLNQRLADSTSKRIEMEKCIAAKETELQESKKKEASLRQDVGDAAVVIAHQRLEIRGVWGLYVIRGNANLLLWCILEETLIKLEVSESWGGVECRCVHTRSCSTWRMSGS